MKRGVQVRVGAFIAMFVLLFSAALFAQDVLPTPGSNGSKERASWIFLTTGEVEKFQDFIGTGSNTFEVQPLNSPTTLTVTIFGCMRGGTCTPSALNTSSGTGNQLLTVNGTFDYYKITASWTGGNANGVQVNRTGAQAPGGASGAAGNVAITGPVDGSSNVKVDCITGCAGSNPNGQAVMASSAPVTLASDQSPVPTQPSGFASIVATQQAVTATAAVLPSNSVHGFCVKALPANGLTVFVGPSGVTTATGYPLAPGDSICYQGSNTNLAYVIASSTGSSVAVSGN